MQFGFRRLAAATVALATVLVLLSHLSASADIHTAGFDCRNVTYGPTSTGTPWPTPPFTPYAQLNLCNDTGQAVNDLHIVLGREARNLAPVSANVPGCPEPGYTYSSGGSPYDRVDIVWQTACIDPGDAVGVYFQANCSTPEPGCYEPYISCFYWTLDGDAVPSASPAINPATCTQPASPTPTPAPCPARDTPPVTAVPTPYAMPPQPIPGGTFRDVLVQAEIPYCNNSGESASDLHIHFANPYGSATIKKYPPGCPPPSFGPSPHTLDEYDLDINWGQPCVDAGESLVVEFYYSCWSLCEPTENFCYTWTLDGAPIDSEGACPGDLIHWGDFDCNGVTNPLDGLVYLRHRAGLTQPVGGNCPSIGQTVYVAGQALVWGDVDCNRSLSAGDALALLANKAVVPDGQSPDCPRIGRSVVVDLS